MLAARQQGTRAKLQGPPSDDKHVGKFVNGVAEVLVGEVQKVSGVLEVSKVLVAIALEG